MITLRENLVVLLGSAEQREMYSNIEICLLVSSATNVREYLGNLGCLWKLWLRGGGVCVPSGRRFLRLAFVMGVLWKLFRGNVGFCATRYFGQSATFGFWRAKMPRKKGPSVAELKKLELAHRLGVPVEDVLTRREAANMLGKKAKQFSNEPLRWPCFYWTPWKGTKGLTLYLRSEVVGWPNNKAVRDKADVEGMSGRYRVWPNPIPGQPSTPLPAPPKKRTKAERVKLAAKLAATLNSEANGPLSSHEKSANEAYAKDVYGLP